MPHATNKYPFEWKIFEWAGRLSKQLTGNFHYPFLILLSRDGRVLQVHFGDAPEQHDEHVWQQLREANPCWFVFDPFEGPVYTYLTWQNAPRTTFERLLGTPFGPGDFTSQDQCIEFPSTWGVTF